MFRRLYWVTEEVDASGSSQIAGVFTSIPDLVQNGIAQRNGKATALRINLVQLDSKERPIGTWLAPDFAGLEETMEGFVRTDEFSADQCQMLADTLAKVS